IAIWQVCASRQQETRRIDVGGALAAMVTLGLLTAALTFSHLGATVTLALVAAGAAAFVVFIAIEQRVPDPMMPLDVWRSRLFASVNGLTFAVYAALSIFMFILPLQLIVGSGLSATASAAALLPIVVELFALSRWTGMWASRAGPRIPLLIGACFIAVGFALLAALGGQDYWRGFFSGSVVVRLGVARMGGPPAAAGMAAPGCGPAAL